MRLAADAKNPRIAALTAQAGSDIIKHDREGNLLVLLLCDDCFRDVLAGEEGEDGLTLPAQLYH